MASLSSGIVLSHEQIRRPRAGSVGAVTANRSLVLCPAPLAGTGKKYILSAIESTRCGGGGLISTALARISVGVVIERRAAKSAWADVLWRPVSVLAGTPVTEPWTQLGGDDEATLFYAGEAVIELHRTETTNYRDNLASGAPSLWVNMRPTTSQPPYELLAVTADPAEGEAFSDAGSNLVEAVPMPAEIAVIVDRFVATHHVERPFVKRQRDQKAIEKAGDE
jgi:uncharacterized protein DUF3305